MIKNCVVLEGIGIDVGVAGAFISRVRGASLSAALNRKVAAQFVLVC